MEFIHNSTKTTSATKVPAVSIGPVLYFWSKAKLQAFYQHVAQSAATTVYVGETVCSKRREFGFTDFLDTAYQLRDAGKQVVLSTLTLIEQQAELKELRRIIDNGEFMVEANDMGAVGWLHEKGLPFVAGSALNIYNELSLRLMVKQGMQRWVLPVELGRDWILRLLAQPSLADLSQHIDIEVFAYGHLPLAWSGRCFTARSENRPKDQCELCCMNYPSGRSTQSQEGQTLFVLNGIQTQSGQRYNLQNDLGSMHGWVDYVRLSPEMDGFFDKVQLFATGINQPLPQHDVNGYWHQVAGFRQTSETIE